MASTDNPGHGRIQSFEDLAKVPSSYAKPEWWKESVIYQIWPASFKDTNGDGIGDLGGVLESLDHIQSLGANIIWLSPIYPSPDHDYGYDVADYKAVKPEYGTMEDVEKLIAELKKRDMKLMMDLVVNHTSDEHEWFKESRSSKDNPKKDWYIWRPAKKGPNGERLPPNNWASVFSGSGWAWCDQRQEYYLCIFDKSQPDLNWENPEVAEAVYDICRFWLDKGVAGFRCDVICQFSKTYVDDGSEYPALPDAEVVNVNTPYQPAGQYYAEGPRIHEFVQGIYDNSLGKYDHITVGETPFINDPEILIKWTHPARKELKMCFVFDIVQLDCDPNYPIAPRKWDLPGLKLTTNKWQAYCHAHNGWPSVYSCNHDQCRPVSRWLSDAPEDRKPAAKTHALHQSTLSGTLYVYQGEEIGMKNIPEDWPLEEYKDVMTINYVADIQEQRANGWKEAPSDATLQQWASERARDNGRTPVQWTASEHGGFTTPSAKPWMRAQTDDAKSGWNVTDETSDPDSVLNFWSKALSTRQSLKEALVYGGFALLDPKHPQIFAYVKYVENASVSTPHALVILNFSNQKTKFSISANAASEGQSAIEEKYRARGPLPSLHNLAERTEVVLETSQGAFTGWNKSKEDQVEIELEKYEGVLFSLKP